MGPIEAIKIGFAKSFQFKGRALSALMLSAVAIGASTTGTQANTISNDTPVEVAIDLCMDTTTGPSQRVSQFAGLGWTTTNFSISEVLQAVIFLGNVDGLDPASWQDTWDWSVRLTDAGTQIEGTVLTKDKSMVVVGADTITTQFCMLLSNQQQVDLLIALLPNAAVVEQGPRTFVRYRGSDFSVMASEFPQHLRPATFHLSNDIQFSATFATTLPDIEVNKQ